MIYNSNLTIEDWQKLSLERAFKWHKVKSKREIRVGGGIADFLIELPYLNRIKRIAIEVKAQDLHTALGQTISYLQGCDESWIAMPSTYCKEIEGIKLKFDLPIRAFDTSKMKDFESESCPFCNQETCRVLDVIEGTPAAKVYYKNPIFLKKQSSMEENFIKVPWISS